MTQHTSIYRELFQQLSSSELGSYVNELEAALENHAQWISQLHRTLICKLPPSSADISDKPYLHCKFGHWFHGIDNPAITSLDSYTSIRMAHQQMHHTAKDILLRMQRGEACSYTLYDQLTGEAEKLRKNIRTLLNELNQNRDLIIRLMSRVFENASEGVVISTPDNTIVSINKAFTDVTGYTEEEAVGKTPAILRSNKHDQTFYKKMWEEINTYGQWQGEIWNKNKQGEEYLEWISISAVNDNKGQLSHYVGIFSDITTHKENEEQLQYLAHYDQLTRLPNRTLFNDRLKQAIIQAKREKLQVAVLFLDLDGFKSVNDTLGHSAGDELLQQVAKRLTNCLRASDTVARFGGDEFTLVLPAIDSSDDIIRVAQKIISDIAISYDLDGTEVAITTSIGISIYPEDGEDSNVLIQRADTAMYHAKRHGKNHYEFFGEH